MSSNKEMNRPAGRDQADMTYPGRLNYIDPEFHIAVRENEFPETMTFSETPSVTREFIWVRMMQGEVCVEIDGQSVYVSASETLFINCRHLVAFRGITGAPAVFRVIAAMPDAVYVPVLSRQMNRIISDDTFSSTVIRPVSQLFSYDFDAIFDLCRHRPDFFEYDIASHFIAMMKQIIRIYHHTNPDEAVNRNVDLQSLREMLGWIGENYREEITVDQIAAAGKMSRSRCTRLFRRYLQESPIEHVQKYRLERSAYLITNTDLQFSEIASRCGFNQQSYFNRLFSRHFSMTPKQMRSLSILKRREANSRQ